MIAAYQAEATVAAAVESALNQTCPPLEIVVCDDGSTDRTPSILESFGSSIRTLSQPNRGESAAKNTAVEAARGEYVVVLDADDLFLPRRLEALGWLASQRPDLDILTTDAEVEADGVAVRRAYHEGWRFPARDQRAAILDRNFVFGLCAVRRRRWLEVGGFDETLSLTADWDFWQRLILSGSGVGLVDEPLARYRLSVGTLSSDRARLVQARITVLSRTAARADLTASERTVVVAALRRERAELLMRRADASLAQGGWGARRLFAKLALTPGLSHRARLGAGLAMLSPALAARRRAKRFQGTVEIGAGLRVSAAGNRRDLPHPPR